MSTQLRHTDAMASQLPHCSVARTLTVVGERWTMLVLREAFYGVRRFDDFQRHLGVARNVLTARLATLVEHDLLVRTPYHEPGQRRRDEYRLTPAGKELLPALIALMQWGDAHLAGPAGPPVTVAHRDCGALVHAELVCDAGHGALTARDTQPEPGPGMLATGT